LHVRDRADGGGSMRVLLATDGSEYSETAAKFLIRFNWSPQDSITVFHAIYALPFPADLKFHFDTLKTIKKDIAPRILDSAVSILKPVRAGISVEISEFYPAECTPDQCIMNAAKSSNVDLIAMGARGIKGIASTFLGSVTRQVTVHASLPVLVVKPAAGRSSGAMKILFAVDGSEHSRAAGRFLSSIPFPDDAEVTIMHVIASAFSDIPERFALEINDRIKDAVASARTREFAESERIIEDARTLLGRRFRKMSVLSKVGDPATEIVRTAEALETDIIAAGCRGLQGIKGKVGSVSRNILTHAQCSVLIEKT
jgi:nucleotide-binding universal stress UspA family protein